jgi:radical SAM superfamily enzyme YgiQ (UPF0313 family)
MGVLLVSTYELGRQPFGLASPAAWLRQAGIDVECVDASRTKLTDDQIAAASMVAFYLPMHTATRLAVPIVSRVRSVNPRAHVCAYGLYAAINETFLHASGVATIIGPEFEQALVDLACRLHGRTAKAQEAVAGANFKHDLPRLTFITPDRRGLPPLAKYASLQVSGDLRRTVGYTEASRGCKHLCRHCPIVPIYEGRFRIIPIDVVLADVKAQVESGAQHITFGDPDFFNGVSHATRLVTALAAACPGITYDVTIKVEHLLKHRDALPILRDTGCLFVTTAVESLDDEVLQILDKGHTRADFLELVDLARSIGLALSPTFVAFTPWTTLASYCELLDTIEGLDLVGHVAPIQWAIRLLLPEGSRLLEVPQVRALAGPLHPSSLTHPWHHADPRVDALQRDIEQTVGVRLNADRFALFEEVTQLAHDRAGLERIRNDVRAARTTIPYLNEPWYC